MLLESHMSMLPLEEYPVMLYGLMTVLEGQACTTSMIVERVEDDTQFYLSACDNGALV